MTPEQAMTEVAQGRIERYAEPAKFRVFKNEAGVVICELHAPQCGTCRRPLLDLTDDDRDCGGDCSACMRFVERHHWYVAEYSDVKPDGTVDIVRWDDRNEYFLWEVEDGTDPDLAFDLTHDDRGFPFSSVRCSIVASAHGLLKCGLISEAEFQEFRSVPRRPGQ